ncbi:MAG: hypothetical protein Q8P36_01780 [bacterium]|nr:hypothetical protein [bacterium]
MAVAGPELSKEVAPKRWSLIADSRTYQFLPMRRAETYPPRHN